MKKLSMLFVLFAGLLFFVGCGSSDSDDTPSGPGVDEESTTLMEALKSPKAQELAGDEGVYIIFVQSRDGATVVNDVETLNTLYLLSAVGTEQTHIYETNKGMDVLNERLIDDVWMETKLYYPADLPDIDFDSAYESVKSVSGDKPIANIAVFYNLDGWQLTVSFTLQGESTDSCEQYVYIVATGEAYQTAAGVKCFFDINDG